MDNMNTKNPIMKVVEQPTSICSQEQNVGFLDASQDVMTQIQGARDPTVSQSDGTSATFAEFFSRPIEIYSATTLAPHDLNPWTAWADSTTVKAKIDNFSLFRGKLMIKIVVNGAPFFVGRSMVSYEPLYGLSAGITVNNLTTGFPATTEEMSAIIQNSQLPHIMIDVTDSQGGCMCLPFIWQDSYLNTTVRVNFDRLGTLKFNPLVAEFGNNISTGNIGYTVYAWCEDVELRVPTNDLSSQGSEGDEYESVANDGIISRPANTISSIAGLLTNVPFIGPFAKATEIAASGIAKIAKIFGYARPADIAGVSRMRREPIGTIAWTEGVDESVKLTLDPKQELTIDPRTVGLNVGDELTIASIAEKYTIFSGTNWFTNNDPDDVLFTAGVHPAVAHLDDITVLTVTPTAICTASSPFRYWSGTIIYKIEVIANKFARGRLLITWDPLKRTNAHTPNATNVMYSQIIDIAEKRTFEFSVPWAMPDAYRFVYDLKSPMLHDDPIKGACSISNSDINDYCNGVFAVSVLNQLSMPGDGTLEGVSIYFSIKAGKDFEVRAPYGGNIQELSYFGAPVAEGSEGEPTKTIGDTENVIGVPPTPIIPDAPNVLDLKSKVFFGDPVVSFRSLLKRYNFNMTHWQAITFTNNYDVNLQIWDLPNFPAFGGYDPEGLFTDGTDPYTPAFMTLLHWLTPCYVGYRGGIRHKYVSSDMGKSGSITNIQINRDASIGTAAYRDLLGINSGIANVSNYSTSSQLYNGNMLDGGHVVSFGQQKNLGIEFPFYSKRRFHLGRRLQRNTTSGTDEHAYHRLRFLNFKNVAASEVTRFELMAFDNYIAIGEDFNLFFYTGPPILYYEVAYPTF
jgi:hypothetical protein